MILEIDNVELYFSNKKLLNGIYLKAEKGFVTGILGRNGCGKSSLLSIIFGTLQPKYKLIRLDGKPVLEPFYQTKKVHFLPQHSLIPNNMKIKNAFKLYKVDWFGFIKMFNSFSFFRDSKIATLSGGERRVIETYLTIKSPKPVILLDEPFSHIAPLYIEKFKELIRIEKQDKTIILTDHYYNDVIDVTDNLYLLKDGHTKRIENLKELEDYNYLTSGTLV